MQDDEIRRKTTHLLLHFPIRLADRSIPINQARVGDDGRIVVGHFVGLLLDGGGGGGGGGVNLLLPTSIDVVVVVAFKCSLVLHPDPEGRRPQLGC